MEIPVLGRPQEASWEVPYVHRQSLKRMKVFATGLLLTMVVLFLLARSFKETSVFFEIVVAFTEAAMVGALADWFAVVALFRHPLGLPIPHTAIIPKNKDRLGENLAHFVRDHFLSQEAIGAKLDALDITGLISRVLSDEQRTKDFASKFVDHFLLMVEQLDEKEVRAFGKHLIRQNLASFQFGPWVAKILEILIRNNRHHLLLNGGIRTVMEWLIKNESGLRTKMKEGNPWWVPGFIDDKILDMLLGKTKELLEEIRLRPDHEVKRHIDEAILEWIHILKESRVVDEKINSLTEKVFAHSSLITFLEETSQDLKTSVLKDLRDQDSTIRKQIEQGLFTLGRSLGENPAVREKINVWLCSSLLRLSSEYADTISSIISDTVRKWDAERTSRTIELYIGKDLQWIRINGTLVGGFVGLLLFVVSRFFH